MKALKILQMTNLNVGEFIEFSFERIGNSVVKDENAFPKLFPKIFFLRVIKSWDCDWEYYQELHLSQGGFTVGLFGREFRDRG